MTNPLARHGGLSYLRVHAKAPERCARFYAGVFGWAVEPRANGGWRFATQDGLLIGAFGDAGPHATPGSGTVPYFYVEDVDAALARVAAHGGTLLEAARDEHDLRIARVRDTEGNEIGLWQFR